MARKKKSGKKPIEQYDHKDKKRVNNPPGGMVTLVADSILGKSLLMMKKINKEVNSETECQ